MRWPTDVMALAAIEPAVGRESAPFAEPLRCEACLGRRASICAHLPLVDLADVAQTSRLRKLRRGEVLSWEEDTLYDVANVRDGALKLTASLGDGREQILGVAWPGAFVGELFGDRSSHRLTALTATTICLFRRTDLVALVGRSPAVSEALLRAMSSDLRAARRSILSLGRKTAGERVASLLIEMRRAAMCDASDAVQMPLNRQQIADLLGMTIETVSRKIHHFARTGVIELDGHRVFRVADEVGLARLAG